MSEPADPSIPDQLRSVIQTQHPGISVEIEGAINVLRKIQKITGPPAPGKPAAPAGEDSSLIATTDSTNEVDTDPIAKTEDTDTEACQAAGRDAPVLAAGEAFG